MSSLNLTLSFLGLVCRLWGKLIFLKGLFLSMFSSIVCVLELHHLQHCLLLTMFQPPDEIEVGDDGFKQWDGKNGVRCRKQ